MPRPKTRVKTKTSPGFLDLHFHGAFGIDLMDGGPSGGPEAWNAMSEKLAQNGLAGFCATTLSAPWENLLPAVERLGRWIESKKAPGALPLGIHLEGPYLSAEACGAHPPSALRRFSLPELETLWEKSLGTLRILTLAPETLRSEEELRALSAFARKKRIHLSLGHSRATEAQADRAFRAGFRGVTHAWNALAFHQRSPGALGAALGRKDVYIELILDQVHVAPSVLRWTQQLHKACCYVSDCAPAAATTDGAWHAFGPLQVRLQDGASRTEGGHLAGGGILLPEAFRRWVIAESRALQQPIERVFATHLPCATRYPLEALRLSSAERARVGKMKLRWRFGGRESLSLA